jgi:Xaa-Pro dipeptidase
MILFDYDRASYLMEAHGIDVLLPHTLLNAGYFADHWKHELTSSIGSYLLGDGGTPYSLLVGLPRDQRIEPFVTCRTGGEESDMFQHEVWIKDKRFWGPVLPNREASSPFAPYDKVYDNPIEAAADTLRDRGLDRATIGVEMRFLGVEPYSRLRGLLPDATFVDALPMLSELRMVKTAEEVRRMRFVAQATQDATEAMFAVVEEGTTGYDVERMLAVNHWKAGVRHQWIITCLGPTGTKIINPSDTPARRGEIVRVDAGADYKHYQSDISRVACLGEPTTELLNVHNAMRNVMQAVIETIKPGVVCEDVYAVGQRVFDSEGYDSFLTIMAHGLGRDLHELPLAKRGDKTVIEAGMVFCIEPVTIVDGLGVIAIEDEILVTPDGCESLSWKGRELYVVE